MAQPMSHACDARVVGSSDSVAFRLVEHRAELADSEWLAVFPNTPLQEESRPFRVQFDEHGNDEQRQKQHHKSHECHDTVEAPLEKVSYVVFTFRHVAWPPC